MSEIVYYCKSSYFISVNRNISRLSKNELHVFNRHLELCGQKILSQQEWDSICNDKITYYVLFYNGIPVARASVEKYSEEVWEVADVRVAADYRNRGFATDISRYVLKLILENGRSATIRTEDDNLSMKRVISKLGFVKV